MNENLLFENEKKRIEYPLSRLFCFMMFNVWQMGIIYYMGPALSIDGNVPLPISMDNTTTLIVAAYIICIILLIIIPDKFVWAARASALVALVTAFGLFLPLAPETLALLLYIQVFCCCFMIGFESATIVFLLKEKTAILHLMLCYPIGYFIIAFIQNEIAPIPFSGFRFGIVIMLIPLTYFYGRLPSGNCPRFVKKSDNMVRPKKLLSGAYFLALLGALLGVIGPAVAAESNHGVSMFYGFAGIAALILYYLYKRRGMHPLKTLPFAISIGALGYLLLFISLYVPALQIPACVLISVSTIACALLPLVILVVVKQYPSRFAVAILMSLAVVAVVVHSSMLEIFRSDMTMLYLAYLAIIIATAIVYLLVSPFLLGVLNEKLISKETGRAVPVFSSRLSVLTERELEVADLISRGYSNRDIAKMLFISEYTVKDHTKNIYRKLNIHSRLELAAIVNKN